ncbi:CPBP family intramembrane glutamic endopeptidase [Saccharopolyspora sp. NPDC050389]|uniref:CPBP family intramembrane glutamic endopeptidase n=1 Tax=Saccharopolyspora sp. NPDC050389 TaxID=3155516 RepID=UPI0033EF57AA
MRQVRPAVSAPPAIRPTFSLPVFLAVALGGAWLVATPMWLAGIDVAAAGMAMMFTPAIAVLLARKRGVGVVELVRRSGLALGQSRGRTLGVAVAILAGIPALTALAIALAAVFGLVRLGPGDVITALATIPVGMLVLLPTAFGEEWGWRGVLVPRLAERYANRVSLAVVSGGIWGLWHAPLGLYFGAKAPLLLIPLCAFFMVCAALLNWTRLATGSVWPAVVGHALLNASPAAMLAAVTSTATTSLDGNGIAGMAIWMAVLAIAVLLRRTGRDVRRVS